MILFFFSIEDFPLLIHSEDHLSDRLIFAITFIIFYLIQFFFKTRRRKYNRSVVVNFIFIFALQLEGFSAPKLRKDCERMKSEWMMARTEVENLQTNQVNLEERIIEEREDHKRALEHLRAERKCCVLGRCSLAGIMNGQFHA